MEFVSVAGLLGAETNIGPVLAGATKVLVLNWLARMNA